MSLFGESGPSFHVRFHHASIGPRPESHLASLLGGMPWSWVAVPVGKSYLRHLVDTRARRLQVLTK